MRIPNLILPLRALLAAGLLCGAARAQFPAQDMDSRSLGLAYTFGMRGQTITDATVASHEVMHLVGLAYAPVPYVALMAGAGVDRLSVAPHGQTRFRGGYGLSPTVGLAAYSPFFALDLLRGTAGGSVLFLNSEDNRGFRYSATIANPFLGLIVSPTRFLDVSLGGRLHLVEGIMRSGNPANEAVFANNEIARGYLSFNLKTPFERAFLNVDFDFSPAIDLNWSDGPRESSVAVTFGTLLGWKGKSQPATEKPVYFPAYQEMKDRQRKMAEEIE